MRAGHPYWFDQYKRKHHFAGHQSITLQDIAVREELISAQESMLNLFRCRFDFDTHAVPGGCADGKPGADPPQLKPFVGVPTQHDVAEREEVIRVQESVLNHYRCQFGVDTQVVPGGCP